MYKDSSRRNFINNATIVGLGIPFISIEQIFAGALHTGNYQSAFQKISLNERYPSFSSFSIDSLGGNKFLENPILAGAKQKTGYKMHADRDGISYFKKRLSPGKIPDWQVSFLKKSVSLTGTYSIDGDHFDIMINQELNHTSVLGIIKEKNKISLPALIHCPGMGTIRVTSDNEDAFLFYDARRNAKPHFVKIAFPSATQSQLGIRYNLEIVAVYPDLPGWINFPWVDGYKRNFINIFQVNPRLGVLANNSSSDPCALNLYISAELAKHCPALAKGLTAMDLVKMSLNRYLSGMKAYGLVGYTDNYEGADTISWNSPYDTLDSHPSLLLSACYYIDTSKEYNWLRDNLDGLIEWGRIIIKRDIDDDGLIEYELSGNYGSWQGTSNQRPANWWDTIGFGHKDAYSNAIAYKALLQFGNALKHIGKDEDASIFISHAAKIKQNYYSTFYNEQTGVLAGWRSADGQLHDYYFTFINGIAVAYGLITPEQGRDVMHVILEKMISVGYTNFSLGLPGNLIPIKKGDYTVSDHRWGGPSLEDGSDAFQIYENGGATACHTYFTIDALQKLGMNKEADTILFPILDSISKGEFSGKCKNGNSRDWKTWTGECWGYEGFLGDGYLVLLSALKKYRKDIV